MAATRIVFDPSIRHDGVSKSTLNYASARESDEIEMLYQQHSEEKKEVKSSPFPELPVVEDGCFVYQIVRSEGVITSQHPMEFYSSLSSDVFAPPPRNRTMDETVFSETKGSLIHLFRSEADEVLSEGGSTLLGSQDDEDDEEEDLDYVIQKGRLIEVNQVVHHNGTTILHLSDNSGWLAAEWKGEVGARRVNIEKGLWSWCVDNFPNGITARSQPIDSLDLTPSEKKAAKRCLLSTLLPLQKIYCDMRVKHPETGVIFYRLQSSSSVHSVGNLTNWSIYTSVEHDPTLPSLETDGTGYVSEGRTVVSGMRDDAKMTCNMSGPVLSSRGWVFDRTKNYRIGPGCPPEDRFWLIDESLVEWNQFLVFQALNDDLFVQTGTDVTYNSQRRDSLRIAKYDMVIVSVVRHSPGFEKHGHGPFLYLADGAGWLYRTRNHHPVMKEVHPNYGYWECLVQTESSSIELLSHPMNVQIQDPDSVQTFAQNSVLQCDCKVVNPRTGVSFYRVIGTEGWIADTLNDTRVLEVLSFTPVMFNEDASSTSYDAWTCDFVRGIVATEPNYREMKYEDQSRVMSFVHTKDQNLRLNIFLRTRTAVRLSCKPHKEDQQLPVLEIFQKACKRNCTPKELLQFVQQDFVERAISSDHEPELETSSAIIEDTERTTSNTAEFMVKEDEFRHELLENELLLQQLLNRRRYLLNRVTMCDDFRTSEIKKALKLEENEACQSDGAEDYTTANTGTSSGTHTVVTERNDDEETCQSRRTDRDERDDQVSRTDTDNADSDEVVDQFHELALENAHDFGLSVIASPSAGLFGGLLSYGSHVAKTPIHAQQEENTGTESRKSKANSTSFEDDDVSATLSVASSRKPSFFCGECHRSFNGKYSRDIHCREVHSLHCRNCGKIFSSMLLLDEHLCEAMAPTLQKEEQTAPVPESSPTALRDYHN